MAPTKLSRAQTVSHIARTHTHTPACAVCVAHYYLLTHIYMKKEKKNLNHRIS